jgi:hypothetical protein
MADTPAIKVTGQGSQRQAAQLGQTIAEGVASALANVEQPLHIETLRLQLPAGVGNADIERALCEAIRRRLRGGRN